MSPKRKRVNSTPLAPLNTVLINQPSDDPDSPRSKVADHLRTLDLRQKPASPTATPPPAKRRVAWQTQDNTTSEISSHTARTTVSITPPKDYEVLEIGETPGAYDTHTHYPTSPPLSPSPLRPLLFSLKKLQTGGTTKGSPSGSEAQRKKAQAAPTPITSAPPPTPLTSPGEEQVQPLDTVTQQLSLPTLPFRPVSPSPHKSPHSSFDSVLSTSTSSSSSSPQTWGVDLTWQDHEITGHTISPDEPDDDGEGINGIGFRPTPAIAARRSEIRRRQVSEWRAREARDARQTRIEKRRVGSGGIGKGGAHVGLGVRRDSGMKRGNSNERKAIREDAKRRGVRFVEAG